MRARLYNHIILGICLTLCAVVLAGCKDKDDAVPEAGDTYPNLNKFTELVDACAVWKSGCGQTATGGQGSTTVYRITSLEDKSSPDPGMLRYALKQTGKRIIIFDVAGTIELCAPLLIEKAAYGDVTILGQSAPGQGICLANYPLIINNTQNVVVRFIRVRLGQKSLETDKETDYDAISVNNSRNILIDHCSASWSVDECVSCYGNENFTLQYSFITESLRDAGHVKGPHGYGGIWGGKNATFHHNLLAHHDSRNPRFDHDFVDNKCIGPVDYVNNVVYNWGGNSTYGGESVREARTINMVANYYKYGPSTSPKYRLLNATTYCTNCVASGKVQPGSFYLADNYMFESTTVTEDNWKGVTVDKKGTATVDDCKSATRHAMSYDVPTQTAQEAYETVLAKAGCSLSRDAVDERIVKDVQNGTGKLIDSPEDVGGYPVLDGGEAVADADQDGLPDEWEKKYGLDPGNRKDARLVSLVSGYTNLEVYLNDKVKHLY